MVVSATEFKNNFGKYLGMLLAEDIFITKNGKTIAKVSNPNVSAVDSLSGLLAGQLSQNYNKDDLRLERLTKYEIND